MPPRSISGVFKILQAEDKAHTVMWEEILEDEENPLAPYLHSAEWHEDRRNTLRGSDATIIARGNQADVCKLWRIKTGRLTKRDSEPSLAALLGHATEDLNWRWFASVTGRPVWGINSQITHPEHPWMGLSCDGITIDSNGNEAYLELKCVSFEKDIWRLYQQNREQFSYLISYRKWAETIILPMLVSEYMAQCHHAMFVGEWGSAILCPIIGNQQYPVEISFNTDYWEVLSKLEQKFWSCVQEDRKPDETVCRGIRYEDYS